MWPLAEVGLMLQRRLLVHPQRQRPLLADGSLSPVADAQVGHLD